MATVRLNALFICLYVLHLFARRKDWGMKTQRRLFCEVLRSLLTPLTHSKIPSLCPGVIDAVRCAFTSKHTEAHAREFAYTASARPRVCVRSLMTIL